MTATADALMAIFGFKRVEGNQMNTKNDGGPAFPHHFTQDSVGDCKGMTLRDYFAAKAMQGMYAADSSSSVIPLESKVRQAYAAADAMLAERGPQQ